MWNKRDTAYIQAMTCALPLFDACLFFRLELLSNLNGPRAYRFAEIKALMRSNRLPFAKLIDAVKRLSALRLLDCDWRDPFTGKVLPSATSEDSAVLYVACVPESPQLRAMRVHAERKKASCGRREAEYSQAAREPLASGSQVAREPLASGSETPDSSPSESRDPLINTASEAYSPSASSAVSLTPKKERQTERKNDSTPLPPSSKGESSRLRNVGATSDEISEPETEPKYSAAFIEFWKAYPSRRRADKRGCFRKWRLHRLESEASKIISAIRRADELSPDWRQGYIPLTTTFLNQRRWETMLESDSNSASDSPEKAADEERRGQERHVRYLARLLVEGNVEQFRLYEKKVSPEDFRKAHTDVIEEIERAEGKGAYTL